MRRLTPLPLAAIAAFVTTSSARAEPIVVVPDISTSFPSTDAPAPRNLRPVLFGSDVADMAFVLVDGAAEVPLDHEKVPGELNGAAYLVDLGDVGARASVTVAARCAGCAFTAQWTLADDVDDQAPAFDDGPGALTVNEAGAGAPFAPTHYDLELALPGVRDASPVRTRLRGDIEGFGSEFIVDASGAQTLCSTASALDAAGNETDFPDELCVDLDPSAASCGSTSTAPFAWLALLLLLRLPWRSTARLRR